MALLVIMALAALGIIMHIALGMYGKKGEVSVNVKDTLESVIKKREMNTIVKEGPSIKPCYDYDKDQVEIREGQTTKHLAEGFHELGHAIDAYKKGLLDKNYDGLFYGILFYIMKYSLPLAFFFHATVAGAGINSIAMVVVTYILIILSLYFTTVTLMEEVRANKHGKEALRNTVKLNKKQWKQINISLLGGMTSYIVLFLIAYSVLGFHVYYHVNHLF